MSTVEAEDILKQIADFEHELFIKPRLEVAEFFGLDKTFVTKDTVFILSGPQRKGLPAFIRFSNLIEKGTAVMMNDPDKLNLRYSV